jgi:peptide/nickel transport system ATP-binding protein
MQFVNWKQVIYKMAPIIEIKNLQVSYRTREGKLPALRDLDITINRGESYGIVGESGCGKSTLALAIIRYLDRNGVVDGGEIRFNGEDLLRKSEREMRSIWGSKITMVYQDPTAALNPSMVIGRQISEIVEAHENISQNEALEKAVDILGTLQIPDPRYVAQSYPHQLSGGMRQRVCIGMALVTNPDLLIMDEPTTNLDVTTEANILDMIQVLKQEYNATIIYITHDLGIVYKVTDRAGVMYGGQLIEEGPIANIIENPFHPYTRGLLQTIPEVSTSRAKEKLEPIRGFVVELGDLPPGCTFSPRCRDMQEGVCNQYEPELVEVGEGHRVRCNRITNIETFKEEMARKEKGEKFVHEIGEQQGEMPLLRIDKAKKYFEGKAGFLSLKKGPQVKAVDGIDLAVTKNTTMGLVGESGCGKSTLIRTIIGLESITDGAISFREKDISMPISKRDRELAKQIQIVFQDPKSTLNPKKTIEHAITRPIRMRGVPYTEAVKQAEGLLEAVHMGPEYLKRYPDQISGGQKQRIAIARAFASNPELILCDEPTSSLDVSIQASIINLLIELQEQEETAYFFISHDLGVVSYLSDLMAVMYLGRIVEYGPTEQILSPPYHPYTEALLSSISIPDPTVEQKTVRLSGSIPSAREIPSGCRFNTRCPRKIGEICEREDPPKRMADGHNNHIIFCHIPLEELKKVEPVFKREEE